jgi:hypothetical protein
MPFTKTPLGEKLFDFEEELVHCPVCDDNNSDIQCPEASMNIGGMNFKVNINDPGLETSMRPGGIGLMSVTLVCVCSKGHSFTFNAAFNSRETRGNEVTVGTLSRKNLTDEETAAIIQSLPE